MKLRTFKTRAALTILAMVGVILAAATVYVVASIVIAITGSKFLGVLAVAGTSALWLWPFVANYREDKELDSFYRKGS